MSTKKINRNGQIIIKKKQKKKHRLHKWWGYGSCGAFDIRKHLYQEAPPLYISDEFFPVYKSNCKVTLV